MNSKLRITALVVIVSTVLLGISYGFRWLSSAPIAPDNFEGVQPSARAIHPEQEASEPLLPQAASSAGTGLSAESALVPLDMSDQELITRGAGVEVIAYSREEAEWLARNGYPTLEQLAEIDTTPIEELRARATTGGAVDLALLTHKRMRMGNCATKVQAMECAEGYRQAGVRGSLWALVRYVSTAKYFEEDVDDETRRWIDAHELVAERLGMHDELTEGQNLQLRQLRGDDTRVSELADEVLASINAERAALGLAPWARDPRPAEARQRALNEYLARSMDSSGRPRTNVRRYHYPRDELPR